MRVLYVDDHPLARKGLETLLHAAFPGSRLWEGSRLADAPGLAARVRPDIIVLDLVGPAGPSAAQTCAALRAQGTTVPILILTAHADLPELTACLVAGASGALLKDSSTAWLTAALRQALSGERVLDPRLRASLGDVETGDPQPAPVPSVRLTARELEILHLLAEGQPNRAIAERLVVAESTVKWHVRQLLTKLGVEGRWQAVVRAQDLGLL